MKHLNRQRLAKIKPFLMVIGLLMFCVSGFAEHNLCPQGDVYLERHLPKILVFGNLVNVSLTIHGGGSNFIDIAKFTPDHWIYDSISCTGSPTIINYNDGLRITYLTYPNEVADNNCTYTITPMYGLSRPSTYSVVRITGYAVNNHIDCLIQKDQYVTVWQPQTIGNVLDKISQYSQGTCLLNDLLDVIQAWSLS